MLTMSINPNLETYQLNQISVGKKIFITTNQGEEMILDQTGYSANVTPNEISQLRKSSQQEKQDAKNRLIANATNDDTLEQIAQNSITTPQGDEIVYNQSQENIFVTEQNLQVENNSLKPLIEEQSSDTINNQQLTALSGSYRADIFSSGDIFQGELNFTADLFYGNITSGTFQHIDFANPATNLTNGTIGLNSGVVLILI